MASASPNVRIYEDDAGEWRWRLQGANGEITAVASEGYTRKRDAFRGWETARRAFAAAVLPDDPQPAGPDGQAEA